MKHLVELPDVIKDAAGNEYEPTGEYRVASNEWILVDGVAVNTRAICNLNKYVILRHKWTWPAWLKGWGIAMDKNGRSFVYAEKVQQGSGGWDNGGNFISIVALLNFTDFTPPVITDWTIPVLNPNWKGGSK